MTILFSLKKIMFVIDHGRINEEMKLNREFKLEEQDILNMWKDDKLEILDCIEAKCYILSLNGSVDFSECFGFSKSDFETKQRYILATPNKVIKYYNYYLLENMGEEGEWYVGEMYENGNIEFYKCCESLEEAFRSI